MGFNAWFFARIDYQDKVKRLNESSMEMIWYPQTSQGNENRIFTAVNYAHYSWPDGFNFEGRDNPKQYDPIRSDPNLEDYNLDTKADAFVAYFQKMCTHYRSTQLMHTFGNDFVFSNARKDFKNMDILFNYINKNSAKFNMKVVYSTPQDYVNTIYNNSLSPDNQIVYPDNNYDFFPYADFPNAFWTGYFTSRVELKRIVR